MQRADDLHPRVPFLQNAHGKKKRDLQFPVGAAVLARHEDGHALVRATELLLLEGEVGLAALATAHDGAVARVEGLVALLEHGLELRLALLLVALDGFERGAAAHFFVRHACEVRGRRLAEGRVGLEVVEQVAHVVPVWGIGARVEGVDAGVERERGVEADGGGAVLGDPQPVGRRRAAALLVEAGGEAGLGGALHRRDCVCICADAGGVFWARDRDRSDSERVDPGKSDRKVVFDERGTRRDDATRVTEE